jgi:hypothetical protein
MSEGQAEVAALGWEIRLAEEIRREQRPDAEYWFAVEPHVLPDAHTLAEKGWLHRRIGEDVEWRLTNAALYSLRMDVMRTGLCMN